MFPWLITFTENSRIAGTPFICFHVHTASSLDTNLCVSAPNAKAAQNRKAKERSAYKRLRALIIIKDLNVNYRIELVVTRVKRNSEGKSCRNTTFTPFFIISELRYAIINGNLFLIIPHHHQSPTPPNLFA